MMDAMLENVAWHPYALVGMGREDGHEADQESRQSRCGAGSRSPCSVPLEARDLPSGREPGCHFARGRATAPLPLRDFGNPACCPGNTDGTLDSRNLGLVEPWTHGTLDAALDPEMERLRFSA